MATMTKKLREGFSTGSAATAAAMAALHMLLSAGEQLKQAHIPVPPIDDLPIEPALYIPIHNVESLDNSAALGIVQKDGGDDPDVTNKAFIHAVVKLNNTGVITLDGGQGVGRFTLPGLPLPVGEAAINPAPRKQIQAGLKMVAKKFAYNGGIEVCISVPRGAEIAKHTFNPRLGIVGGISILGTQGTVKPFSHDAWKSTIAQGLQVAASTGCTRVCLSTGRRSERLLLMKYPTLPAHAAVQVADFAQFSLQESAKHDFEYVEWGCFFGKLVKLAQGHAYTHAHHADLDFELLAQWCRTCGLENASDIRKCVTANHALEIILSDIKHFSILEYITRRAAKIAATFAGRPIHVHLFHFDGRTLISI